MLRQIGWRTPTTAWPLHPCIAAKRTLTAHAFSRKYTPDHEWVDISNQNSSRARIGLTQFASEALGEIVFAEAKPVRTKFKQGEPLVTLESVKTVAEVRAPFDGVIAAVNEPLIEDPSVLSVEADKPDAFLVDLVSAAGPIKTDSLLDQSQYQSLVVATAESHD